MSHDGHSHVTVEELVLEHYALPEHGAWSGTHCESGIWVTLFTLLLWDAIFSPVPDVFRTPFQLAPLDLDTDAFLPARGPAIEAALTGLRAGGALEMLQTSWKAHYGAQLPMLQRIFLLIAAAPGVLLYDR
jgi:Fanconi-associated nuclease 1